ncbi:MAG: diaminopimelate decarboxylase [Puniceicoccales bacterium]|jgi:diaminopimelate decarboxylase|nr:diaminopimelate decarboxylase [Puniceicoccales bacterium]
MRPTSLLHPSLARQIAATIGTPAYVYSQPALEQHAAAALAFPNAFGITVRFAMKALPNAAILRLFHKLNLHFDASSTHEAYRAIRAGIPSAKISISTQELSPDFIELLRMGVLVNACSLAQLAAIGQHFPGLQIGIRLNPGTGSGSTGKTNVGGPDASFGIWHEYLDDAIAIAHHNHLQIIRLHTHIGSGSDPLVWQHAALQSLALVRRIPTIHTLNLGGGYKVARTESEHATDLQNVGTPIKTAIQDFAAQTNRQLHLEIEPGTFLTANSGVILTRIQDITDTGTHGRRFLKLDSGMTELLRPPLYGAQHPVEIVPATPSPTDTSAASTSCTRHPYIIVGHCCESGDLLTCAPGEPDTLAPRELPIAHIGDLCLIGGAGAYCSSMSAKNYNSFPEAPEILVTADNSALLIRRRQTLDQIVENEILPNPPPA